MLNALFYLRLTSFKNWFVSRVRRLRQPKYLLSAIVGIAYFYFFFFRAIEGPPASREGAASASQALAAAGAVGVSLPVDWLPLAAALGALALLFFATCMWTIPTERAALGFSEAEIAFLFPAPITRRGLVHFRLLSTQFRSLAGAAIMMLFSQRWTFLGGNALTHAVGWWFVFSGLNLHLSGARFTLTRLADLGVPPWRRRLLVLAFVAAIVAATLARLPAAAAFPLLPASTDLRPFTDWLLVVTGTAPLSWVLWPFQLVLAPFLAPDARSFLLALAPAAAVVTLHYLWVVRSAVAFEDASVAHAQKRATRLAALRSGQARIGSAVTKPRRPPFALATTGAPEIAFLWKNLLSAWPYFNWRVFLGCAAVIAFAGLWLRAQPAIQALLPAAGVMVLAFAGYALIVGPQFARQDLRGDLANSDILKTYPLPGWRIVLGQLLTPVAILTGILWLSLLAAVLTLTAGTPAAPWLTPGLSLAATIGLALIMPPLAAVQLLVPNAAALYFPGWFHTSRTRGGGPEVIGQRMIFFFAQLVTMAAALAPAALLGLAFLALAQWLAGPIVGVMVATNAVLIVLVAEVAGGVWLLGRRFEQLDLSAELRS